MSTPSRLASFLLLFFATTHTLGGLLSARNRGPAADGVLISMKTTHFTFQGADCTFYGFYFGFGLLVAVFLVFSAAVAWVLGGVATRRDGILRETMRPIVWAFWVPQVATAVLSWKYFFPAPGVVSTLVAALVGWDCVVIYGAG